MLIFVRPTILSMLRMVSYVVNMLPHSPTEVDLRHPVPSWACNPSPLFSIGLLCVISIFKEMVYTPSSICIQYVTSAPFPSLSLLSSPPLCLLVVISVC
jgi:hypothetical protein